MSYEIVGDIAILPPNTKKAREKAKKIIKNKQIKSVLIRGRVKGRLRKAGMKFLAGRRNRETIHKENGCKFLIDVAKVYFSARLGNERLEIAERLRKRKAKRILVMFAGAGPFSVIIAKRNPKAEVVSMEIGKEASKYAEKNMMMNKLKNMRVVQGDAKKIKKLVKGKFDAIVMPRPQLPYTFLNEAKAVSGKNCLVFFYDFAENEKEVRDRIKDYAKKILLIKKQQGLSPRFYRWRADFII